MSVININKENFQQEVLQSDRPVLVDFWAPWCGPCRMVGPVVDQIAEEHPEIKVCKLSVDDCPEIAAEYGVMSIPALYVFKNGEAVNHALGAKPKHQILALFD